MTTINHEPDSYCLPLAPSTSHKPDKYCLRLLRSTYHGSHWVRTCPNFTCQVRTGWITSVHIPTRYLFLLYLCTYFGWLLMSRSVKDSKRANNRYVYVRVFQNFVFQFFYGPHDATLVWVKENILPLAEPCSVSGR